MARKSTKRAENTETLAALIKDLITVELVIAGAGPKEVRKVLGSADNNKISAIKSIFKKGRKRKARK